MPVSGYYYNLTVSTSSNDLNPNYGTKNGGYNLTIFGHGFHYYDLSLTKVIICDQQSEII